VHPLEDLGLLKPPVQLEPAHAQRILQILAGAGTKTIEGNRERGNSNFAHGDLPDLGIVFKAEALGPAGVLSGDGLWR
jgi:hypothetical protein